MGDLLNGREVLRKHLRHAVRLHRQYKVSLSRLASTYGEPLKFRALGCLVVMICREEGTTGVSGVGICW